MQVNYIFTKEKGVGPIHSQQTRVNGTPYEENIFIHFTGRVLHSQR